MMLSNYEINWMLKDSLTEQITEWLTHLNYVEDEYEHHLAVAGAKEILRGNDDAHS